MIVWCEYEMKPNYDQEFYRRAEKSLGAAKVIAGILHRFLDVRSILDVGCAQGTWLAAWRDLGCLDVMGIDGSYIDRNRLVVPNKKIIEFDLESRFDLGRRFDLVQCLEVAEHLSVARSSSLVEDLTAHSDIVLFSAAPPGQGGAYHVNEQPYEFWRELFNLQGYAGFDCIRPLIRSNKNIPFWYRYNVMLYVRKTTSSSLRNEIAVSRLRDDMVIKEMAPPSFRIRKAILRKMPKTFITNLANLQARIVG